MATLPPGSLSHVLAPPTCTPTAAPCRFIVIMILCNSVCLAIDTPYTQNSCWSGDCDTLSQVGPGRPHRPWTPGAARTPSPCASCHARTCQAPHPNFHSWPLVRVQRNPNHSYRRLPTLRREPAASADPHTSAAEGPGRAMPGAGIDQSYATRHSTFLEHAGGLWASLQPWQSASTGRTATGGNPLKNRAPTVPPPPPPDPQF